MHNTTVTYYAFVLYFSLWWSNVTGFRAWKATSYSYHHYLPIHHPSPFSATRQGLSHSFGHSWTRSHGNVRMTSQREREIERRTSDGEHLFRFGIIADIQYAEATDALNFDRTKYRRYHHSLNVFRNAVRYWKEVKPVDFTLALGDIVDAKAAGKRRQIHCLEKVLDEHNTLDKALFLCFGNHCQHCFTRDFMRENLIPKEVLDQPQFHTTRYRDSSMPQTEEDDADGIVSKHLFYHWSPCPGWRFISVDTYDLSIVGPSCANHARLSEELISANNPNDLTNGSAWFIDQPYDKIRWAPYNGGIGQYQLMQIERILEYSAANNEKVILFGHQPVFSPLKPKSLVWNSEDVLRVLWKFGNRVVAWFAGHDHDGHCAVDPFGIYHIVPPAPIECEVGEEAYGSLTVFEDKIEFDWVGDLPKHTYSSWPNTIQLKA